MTPKAQRLAREHHQRQINLWMNELADHGDSFDDEGKDILAKIKFHNACLKTYNI